jgi:flagellar hook-associated protein 2
VATLSSPGVGSNLDVKGIVSKLMTAEQGPLLLLGKQEASFNAKLSAFGSLKSTLSTLQQAAQTLNLSSTFSSVKPSVADASVLSAGINGTASAGTYNIEVASLAQSQKLISSGYASSSAAVGTGTFTISTGTYSAAGAPPVSFSAKSGTSPISITIDSTNNTLEGIRNAINDARAGVSATIINDGTSFRLALTATESGLSNAVRIGVAETGDAGLAQLAYDASNGGVSNLTQNAAAANAVIKVDGVTITKPGNIITDAIQGVTLNLTSQTATGVTTKLTLTRDTDGVSAAIDNFVKAYNAVNKQIADSTAFNTSTGKGSILTGDATVRGLQVQLRATLSNMIGGAQSGLTTLSDIGVSFQKDGSLTIDADKRAKVLADPAKDVKRLFVTSTDGTLGFGARVNTLVSGMIFGDEAILNGRIDGINNSIKGIGKQRLSQNDRLDALERRYTTQFSALDTMMSSMNTTSAFLTQQFNALNVNK